METPPAAGQPSLASLFISSVEHRHDELRRRPRRLDATGGVQMRRWLDDKRFPSGYALSQLVPGTTNVNLAVFISTQMRGALGAIACF
jgi:chromate transporter